MQYKSQYSESAFLHTLSSDPFKSKSTAAIMNTLGCSRNTAKTMLVKLEKDKKIKRLEIEGTKSFGWIKIE